MLHKKCLLVLVCKFFVVSYLILLAINLTLASSHIIKLCKEGALVQ